MRFQWWKQYPHSIPFTYDAVSAIRSWKFHLCSGAPGCIFMTPFHNSSIKPLSLRMRIYPLRINKIVGMRTIEWNRIRTQSCIVEIRSDGFNLFEINLICMEYQWQYVLLVDEDVCDGTNACVISILKPKTTAQAVNNQFLWHMVLIPNEFTWKQDTFTKSISKCVTKFNISCRSPCNKISKPLLCIVSTSAVCADMRNRIDSAIIIVIITQNNYWIPF